MTKINKGFTLIELLVVIAIIGILAGILFIAINPKAQTDKANVAKDKSELASVRTQAALIFSSKGDYDDVCDDSNVQRLSDDCADTSSEWAASKTNDNLDYDSETNGEQHTWCVDSSGYTGVPNSSYTAGTSTSCNPVQ